MQGMMGVRSRGLYGGQRAAMAAARAQKSANAAFPLWLPEPKSLHSPSPGRCRGLGHAGRGQWGPGSKDPAPLCPAAPLGAGSSWAWPGALLLGFCRWAVPTAGPGALIPVFQHAQKASAPLPSEQVRWPSVKEQQIQVCAGALVCMGSSRGWSSCD